MNFCFWVAIFFFILAPLVFYMLRAVAASLPLTGLTVLIGFFFLIIGVIQFFNEHLVWKLQ